jgi:hypothetical protein
MELLPFEFIYARNIRKPWNLQDTQCWYEDFRLRDVSFIRDDVLCRDDPYLAGIIPLCAGDTGVDDEVGVNVVFVRELAPVSLNLGLHAMRKVPVRFQVGGEGIKVDANVRRAPLEDNVNNETLRGKQRRTGYILSFMYEILSTYRNLGK